MVSDFTTHTKTLPYKRHPDFGIRDIQVLLRIHIESATMEVFVKKYMLIYGGSIETGH